MHLRPPARALRADVGDVVLNVSARDGICLDEADLQFDLSCIDEPSGVGPFKRGDCDQDGSNTGQATDAVFLLNFGSAAENSADIHLPYDKFLVAGRLSMKPETFSRALANLREIGVHTEGNLVHIEDVEALRRYANSV